MEEKRNALSPIQDNPLGMIVFIMIDRALVVKTSAQQLVENKIFEDKAFDWRDDECDESGQQT